MRIIDATVANLPDIEQEFLRQTCKRCPLHMSRSSIVWGTGNRSAEIMVVGRSPDADEDNQGLPFVGDGGDLLEKVWADVGLEREELFMTLLNKCHPPENRSPTRDEALMCSPYLIREIREVRPRVIVTLGKRAYWGLTGEELEENTTFPVVEKLIGNKEGDQVDVLIIPTVHPNEVLNIPDGRARNLLMEKMTADWQLTANLRGGRFEKVELKLV